MFTQRLADAFDLTNRRLVYVLLFFLVGLPAVAIILSAGNFQEPAALTPDVLLKFFGLILLYGLIALFAWPFFYGGMIGELAHSDAGSTQWSVFKSWATKSYGRLLLFNLLLLVLAASIVLIIVLVLFFSVLAAGLSSGGDVSAIEQRLSGTQPATGLVAFLSEIFATVFAQAFILILIAAMISLVLTGRGIWRSLGAGFKTFFTGPVFKLYFLAFLVFLFLNLLGVLVFNRPGTARSLSAVYFVVSILFQGYFSVLAIAFLVPNFKPKEEVEVLAAPTG